GNNGPVLLLPDDSTGERLAAVRAEAEEAERALAAYRARLEKDAELQRLAREARPDLSRGLIGRFSFDGVDSTSGPATTVANEADPRYPGTFRGEPLIVPGRESNAFEVRE